MLCTPSLLIPIHSLWHPFWEEISGFPKPSGVCWAMELWSFSLRTLPFELLFVSLQISLSPVFIELSSGQKDHHLAQIQGKVFFFYLSSFLSTSLLVTTVPPNLGGTVVLSSIFPLYMAPNANHSWLSQKPPMPLVTEVGMWPSSA